MHDAQTSLPPSSPYPIPPKNRTPQGFLFHHQGGAGGIGGGAAARQDDIKANPFTHTQYGNNAFNPQKLGSKPMVSLKNVVKSPILSVCFCATLGL